MSSDQRAAETRRRPPTTSAGFEPARSGNTRSKTYGQRRPPHADGGSTAYFVSTRTLDSCRVFESDDTARIAVAELRACRNAYGFKLLAYCFMPDHAHFVLVPNDGYDIAQTMRLIKGRIARRVNEYLDRSGPVWQSGFFDKAPGSLEALNKFTRYTEANPVAAKLARSPAAYAFSSARGDCLNDYASFLGECASGPGEAT